MVDIGAPCVSVSHTLIRSDIEIDKCSTHHYKVNGPDGNPLEVCGFVQLTFEYNKICHNIWACLIKDLKTPLLGRSAIRALDILTPPKKEMTVNSTSIEQSMKLINVENVKQKYPKLFKQLGKFEGSVSIRFRPDARPYLF